jgi:hypothetical protein
MTKLSAINLMLRMELILNEVITFKERYVDIFNTDPHSDNDDIIL